MYKLVTMEDLSKKGNDTLEKLMWQKYHTINISGFISIDVD